MKIIMTYLLFCVAEFSLAQFVMSFYHPVEIETESLDQKRISGSGIKTVYARSVNYSQTGEDFSTQVYSYNKDGRVTEEKYYYDDTILFQTIIMDYDIKGRKIMSSVVGNDNMVKSQSAYNYDKEGNYAPLEFELIYDSQNRPAEFRKINEPKRYIRILYDAEDRIVANIYGYGDAYEEVDSFVYDSQSRVTGIYALHYSYFHLYPDGKDSLITERSVKCVITRSYDENGNLVWSFNSEQPEAEFKAEYDLMNRRVKSFQGNSRKEFDYDSDGNLVRVREYISGELIRITYYSYDFW